MTRDVDRGFRVAREIDAGTVWIDDRAVVYDGFEGGGTKPSSLGRMNGTVVMDDPVGCEQVTMTQGSLPR